MYKAMVVVTMHVRQLASVLAVTIVHLDVDTAVHVLVQAIILQVLHANQS